MRAVGLNFRDVINVLAKHAFVGSEEMGAKLPRVNSAMDAGAVTHKHDIRIYDHRTEVRSSTGSGKPSTSYAFQPVHGG